MLTTRALLTTVLLATISVATALHAQSLADVAKKTEEERAKADKAPAKVFTDKDVTHAESALASAACTVPLSKMGDGSMACRDEAWFRAFLVKYRGLLTEQQNKCGTVSQAEFRDCRVREEVIQKTISDHIKEATLLGFDVSPKKEAK